TTNCGSRSPTAAPPRTSGTASPRRIRRSPTTPRRSRWPSTRSTRGSPPACATATTSRSFRRCREGEDFIVLEKLAAIEAKYEQMSAELATPAVQADNAKFRSHSKAISEMQPLVDRYREYKAI